MLKVGDKLPAGSLQEFIEVEGGGCTLGPNSFDIGKATAGKTIAIFALPGAYTPTCSAQHVPGYVQHTDALKAAGVDEIWCVSVNDAFVMGAWGRDQHTGVRHAGWSPLGLRARSRPGPRGSWRRRRGARATRSWSPGCRGASPRR